MRRTSTFIVVGFGLVALAIVDEQKEFLGREMKAMKNSLCIFQSDDNTTYNPKERI